MDAIQRDKTGVNVCLQLGEGDKNLRFGQQESNKMNEGINEKGKDSKANEHQGDPAAGFFRKLLSSASSCHTESV